MRRASARLAKLAGKVARDRERAAEGARLQGYAHVLQANLTRIPKGAASISLLDFEGRLVTVPLDPARGAVDNMTRLFEKAKRLKGATPRIEERAERISRDLTALARFAGEIERADEAGLASVRAELSQRFPAVVAAVRSARKTVAERSPFHEFAIAAGRVARVGRSAADNDALTLRHARPDDLWLHVRGGAGSHVVVRNPGQGEVPRSVIEAAAAAAAWYSKARGAPRAEVHLCRAADVRKPRHAPAGLVELARWKRIKVRPAIPGGGEAEE